MHDFQILPNVKENSYCVNGYRDKLNSMLQMDFENEINLNCIPKIKVYHSTKINMININTIDNTCKREDKIYGRGIHDKHIYKNDLNETNNDFIKDIEPHPMKPINNDKEDTNDMNFMYNTKYLNVNTHLETWNRIYEDSKGNDIAVMESKDLIKTLNNSSKSIPELPALKYENMHCLTNKIETILTIEPCNNKNNPSDPSKMYSDLQYNILKTMENSKIKRKRQSPAKILKKCNINRLKTKAVNQTKHHKANKNTKQKHFCINDANIKLINKSNFEIQFVPDNSEHYVNVDPNEELIYFDKLKNQKYKSNNNFFNETASKTLIINNTDKYKQEYKSLKTTSLNTHQLSTNKVEEQREVKEVVSDDGYNSSDFEFIDKEEASRNILQKDFFNSYIESFEPDVNTEKIDDSYRDIHEIPSYDEYVSLFRVNLPLNMLVYEDQTKHSEICMDLNYGRTDHNMLHDIRAESTPELYRLAKETEQKILSMYPTENRKK